MSQIPLNSAGGRAAVVQAKLPDSDIARVIRLARLRGKSRSAVARDLIQVGLDAAERDLGPPEAD